jgi:hypothetical protein
VATNFDLAPPVVTFDGKTAVPIDMATVDAYLTFDGTAGAAHGDASVSFVVGPVGGRPIFDLRQTITGVWLDGSAGTATQVLTRDLGGGPGAELRVLDVPLAAGSTHTLRLTYNLALPASPPGGSYPPSLTWTPGPRLTFNFGFTDLVPGRYLEAWVPANLIWDQYALNLELQVTGTAVAHRVLTNGALTPLAANHWRVLFPDRFTALSPLVELRADDTLTSASTTVSLPVSGKTLTIEAWKLTVNTALNLATQLANLTAWLTDNEHTVGPYVHGNRFVAFLIQGGMEYEGGCTSGPGSLRHETFHAWWGRGVKPASQADGWWDEAWNVYHDAGGMGTQPFDFAESPVTLSPRNGYSRITPGTAYTSGERFFEGVAALTSPAVLTTWMGEFYRAHLDRPTTTLDLEAHLVVRSGHADLADAFHRWVYGFADPSPAPDLWLRDDPTHAGSEAWGGRFWDSPDLWVRNHDDGGTTHQAPIAGRDNWFYARLHNRGAGTARHFLVTFQVRQFAGLQFSWPADFLPSVAAAGGFDLAPGDDRVVKARWPAALVPPAGTHACWLAAVLARADRPFPGAHVWEHGNLAQKNLTIVRLTRGASLVLPFVVRGLAVSEDRTFELVRPTALGRVEAAIVPRSVAPTSAPPTDIGHALEHGGLPQRQLRGEILTGDNESGLIAAGFERLKARPFPAGPVARLHLRLPLGQSMLGLLVRLPNEVLNGPRGTIDLVQRDAAGRILGGLAVEIIVDH